MQEQLSLVEMIEKLLQVDDEAWGLYAFSRDILKERIPEGKKIEMIRKAMSCGREYAERTIREYGSSDVNIIAEKLKLNIVFQDAAMIGTRILFASYTPPDEIGIMTEPVNKAVELISKEESILIDYFQKYSIINTMLGHEIFHCVEDRFEKEIYTRTEKILLWNFIGFKNNSTLRALGEIGAMAFTKELNGLKYSPFILDILLYYSYDSVSAEKIYRDVLEMSSGR
ncbi:hypothetical protein [Clostridium lacusfryxellense]|uniref:hypothetical protein n=1 Tax=Clostridium lacusfryxellense TaxID=205328 RepID=UPI001C0B0428|nr:hypothetical protein [Clostridium lacusfryxellense]MBU3112598.1 hypothetical protein [Clostridium lacusfryxellense]